MRYFASKYLYITAVFLLLSACTTYAPKPPPASSTQSSESTENSLSQDSQKTVPVDDIEMTPILTSLSKQKFSTALLANTNRIEGRVESELHINAKGDVTKVEIIKAVPRVIYDDVFTLYAEKLKFKPANKASAAAIKTYKLDPSLTIEKVIFDQDFLIRKEEDTHDKQSTLLLPYLLPALTDSEKSSGFQHQNEHVIHQLAQRRVKYCAPHKRRMFFAHPPLDKRLPKQLKGTYGCALAIAHIALQCLEDTKQPRLIEKSPEAAAQSRLIIKKCTDEKSDHIDEQIRQDYYRKWGEVLNEIL